MGESEIVNESDRLKAKNTAVARIIAVELKLVVSQFVNTVLSK